LTETSEAASIGGPMGGLPDVLVWTALRPQRSMALWPRKYEREERLR
jgi:hypothetical protein